MFLRYFARYIFIYNAYIIYITLQKQTKEYYIDLTGPLNNLSSDMFVKPLDRSAPRNFIVTPIKHKQIKIPAIYLLS